MRVDWRGGFPAATTRFAEDGSVDLAATGHRLEDTWRARWG
jgi:dihydrodipicolinate synthase/N-acetylneuraminate lyase